jgi:hypothetical protein
MTIDKSMRGKNLCPISRRERGRKAAAASPWSKGPTVPTNRAKRIFGENRKAKAD